VTSVQEAYAAIEDVYRDLTDGIDKPCLGVAVAVPGPTDESGRRLLCSESLGWTDVPLADMVENISSCNTMLINCPRAGVLGEYWYGAGVGVQDIVYVFVSSGIGAGILIGGQLFTGAYGFNAEIGHTTILPDGPACGCGNRGCLERLSSMPAIIYTVRERLRRGVERRNIHSALADPDHISYQEVIKAALDGDDLVLDVLREASYYLGIALANLIDLFNPNRVIIGGQLAEAGEIVLNAVRTTAQRRSFPASFAGTEIVRSALGVDAECIGACALVVDRYIAQYEPAMRPIMSVD
jgi:glucokinase